MADILHRTAVKASPEAIYEALTTAKGLVGWWTEHSTVEGSQITVSFYNQSVTFKLRVVESNLGEKVVWAVEAGPPEWSDTTITWTIWERDGQTMLDFAQRGFASTEGQFPDFNSGWGWYVTSLRFLLEKGEGMPHTDADLM